MSGACYRPPEAGSHSQISVRSSCTPCKSSETYPIQIQRVPEGYCAFIPLLKGCKAFGETPEIALNELASVKEGFIEVFLELGKLIPEPVVHLNIPYPVFQQLDNRSVLKPFVVG